MSTFTESTCVFTTITADFQHFILKANLKSDISVDEWNACVVKIKVYLASARNVDEVKLNGHADKISDFLHFSLTFLNHYEIDHNIYHGVGDLINVDFFKSAEPIPTQLVRNAVKPANIIARRNTSRSFQPPSFGGYNAWDSFHNISHGGGGRSSRHHRSDARSRSPIMGNFCLLESPIKVSVIVCLLTDLQMV